MKGKKKSPITDVVKMAAKGINSYVPKSIQKKIDKKKSVASKIERVIEDTLELYPSEVDRITAAMVDLFNELKGEDKMKISMETQITRLKIAIKVKDDLIKDLNQAYREASDQLYKCRKQITKE